MGEYRRALVTFIDILGFRDLIEQSRSGEHCSPVAVDKILRIVSRLKRANDFTGRVKEDKEGHRVVNFSSTNFSDCLVRSTWINSPDDFIEAIYSEFVSIASMQSYVTTYEGMMIRGGMAAGGLYKDTIAGLLFGPALVDAYRLEQKAVVPRILLSEAIVHEIKSKGKASEYYVCENSDGVAYLDYLKASYDTNLGTWPITDINNCNQMMQDHMNAAIKKNEELRSQPIHIRQKAHWMAGYHNGVIQRIVTERPALQAALGDLRINTMTCCQ
jgi:hypothetical protein